MTQSIEYAGTLFRNKGEAQRASVETFLIDGAFTEDNFSEDYGKIADEMLENKWEIPKFTGDREELIDLIDEVKGNFYE